MQVAYISLYYQRRKRETWVRDKFKGKLSITRLIMSVLAVKFDLMRKKNLNLYSDENELEQ